MSDFIHGEGFCLMWYECECGHRERFWNSRDGVTPFCLGCPSCGQASLRHIHWSRDKHTPNHKPHYGQGIWRDGTPEEAALFMAQRLDKCIGTPYEVDDEKRAQLIEAARTDSDGEFRPGWPMFERSAHHG